MSNRLHDADLCERISDLEDEVKRLRDQIATMPHHHCYHYYPQWNSTPWYSPWTVTSSFTAPTVTYGNTAQNGIDVLSTTYTS